MAAPRGCGLAPDAARPPAKEVEIPERSEQLMMQIPANVAFGFVCRISDGAQEFACRTKSDHGPFLRVADRQGCRRAASAQSFL